MQHKGPHPHSTHDDHDHGAHGHHHDHEHGHGQDPVAEFEHALAEHDGHVHSHGHSHALTADGINARMGIALGLNVIFVGIEGTFGFLSNSVALIPDARHNLRPLLRLSFTSTALPLSPP